MAKQGWQNREEKIAEVLGLAKTQASGAWHFKGDAQSDDVMVEIKTTTKKGMRVPLAWFTKLEEQAATEDKLPILVLDFDSDDTYTERSYLCVNMHFLNALMEWLVYDWDGSDE